MLLSMCAVAACGGDDGGTGSVELFVREVMPAEGATEVELDSTVSVIFNQAIDPESADGAVALEGVSAIVAVDQNIVTLTPDAPFDFLTEVRVTVGTGVRGLVGGDTLDAAETYTFTSRARRWSAPGSIGTSPAPNLLVPAASQLAAGPDGRVLALWQTAPASDDVHLEWSAYDPASDSWRAADELATATRDMEPRLASDGNGNLLVAWIDGALSVRVAWIDPATGAVDIPDPLYVADSGASGLALAMSRSGDAAIAYRTFDSLQVSRYLGASGAWVPGETVGPPNADRTALAVTDGGEVTAAWSDFDRRILQASSFDGASWSTVEPLWDGADGTIDRVRLQPLPSGDVAAAWGILASGGGEIHVRLRDAVTGWDDDEVLGTTPAGTAESWPELAIGPGGDILLTWAQPNSFGERGLFARWFRGGWQDTVTITQRIAFQHPVAIDADGNAVTVDHDGNAHYYRADRDEWIESHHGLGDSGGIAVGLAGVDPVVMSGADGKIRVSMYR